MVAIGAAQHFGADEGRGGDGGADPGSEVGERRRAAVGPDVLGEGDDEGEEALSVLDDSINTSVEEELIASIEDLADDQQAELLAFAWVGQGTYDASDWDEAVEEAAAENNIVEELMEMPMLASVLEAGLAAFDINCDGIGDLS